MPYPEGYQVYHQYEVVKDDINFRKILKMVINWAHRKVIKFEITKLMKDRHFYLENMKSAKGKSQISSHGVKQIQFGTSVVWHKNGTFKGGYVNG